MPFQYAKSSFGFNMRNVRINGERLSRSAKSLRSGGFNIQNVGMDSERGRDVALVALRGSC